MDFLGCIGDSGNLIEGKRPTTKRLQTQGFLGWELHGLHWVAQDESLLHGVCEDTLDNVGYALYRVRMEGGRSIGALLGLQLIDPAAHIVRSD
jgi:hypothetical protein